MRGTWAVGTVTLALLLCALPSSTLGQEPFSTPEGVDWRLVSVATAGDESDEDAEAIAVPLGTMATLRLEDGQASGYGGCNAFRGGYLLDGEALSFPDELTTTVVLCDDDVMAIEEAYLGTLPAVRSWLIGEDVLQFVDESGATLLSFEIPSISLTSSELVSLVATLDALRGDIDTLRSEVDDLGVDRLRQRVRDLEEARAAIEAELEALEPERPADSTASFNAAERVLLEGIPARIANHCQPLRSGRPAGTRAAVRCTPDSEAVASVDYFLMERGDAAATFTAVMQEHDVPEATSESSTCLAGRRSQQVSLATWQAEGCFRSGGRANLRFVDRATECRQLPIPDGRRLRSPALYMAVTGTGDDIARLHRWAGGSDDAALTRLSHPIERPRQPRSPGCPA